MSDKQINSTNSEFKKPSWGIIIFYLVNICLTFFLLKLQFDYVLLYVTVLIITTFLASLITTLIKKICFVHWCLSLVLLYIIVSVFNLLPKDTNIFGDSILIIELNMIIAAELVGYVIAVVVKHFELRKKSSDTAPPQKEEI